MGTFTLDGGLYGIAFDGVHMWLPNVITNTVTKLRASDGSVVGTYPVGNYPIGVAFDGVNVWISNSVSNNVSKL